jgi:hypothetical protein
VDYGNGETYLLHPLLVKLQQQYCLKSGIRIYQTYQKILFLTLPVRLSVSLILGKAKLQAKILKIWHWRFSVKAVKDFQFGTELVPNKLYFTQNIKRLKVAWRGLSALQLLELIVPYP